MLGMKGFAINQNLIRPKPYDIYFLPFLFLRGTGGVSDSSQSSSSCCSVLASTSSGLLFFFLDDFALAFAFGFTALAIHGPSGAIARWQVGKPACIV